MNPLSWTPTSIYAHIIGAVLLVLLGLGGGGYIAWEIQGARILELKLQDAKFAKAQSDLAASTQKLQDAAALKAAQDYATALAANSDRTNTITKEITRYVPTTQACIPLGLVRVLNNAASASGDTTDPATGKSDDACAAVSWRSFAADLADDYGLGHANNAQLTALQEFEVGQEQAVEPQKPAPDFFDRINPFHKD